MNEIIKESRCIRTFTGRIVDVFNPTIDMIEIEDIAHALSNLCRFGGHSTRFYSVAEHSLNCAYIIARDNLRLGALLHDSAEAYLVDMPRPIKKQLPEYKVLEDRIMKIISEKYGFEYPLHPLIKKVDNQMLEAEWHYLMLGNDTYQLSSKSIHEAKEIFIKMFNYFKGLTINN